MADEAYLVGPAPSAQSYLRSEVILDAAQKSQADAIHLAMVSSLKMPSLRRLSKRPILYGSVLLPWRFVQWAPRQNSSHMLRGVLVVPGEQSLYPPHKKPVNCR